jgi:hypothetical protein
VFVATGEYRVELSFLARRKTRRADHAASPRTSLAGC